jgi:hypothetical protein
MADAPLHLPQERGHTLTEGRTRNFSFALLQRVFDKDAPRPPFRTSTQQNGVACLHHSSPTFAGAYLSTPHSSTSLLSTHNAFTAIVTNRIYLHFR